MSRRRSRAARLVTLLLAFAVPLLGAEAILRVSGIAPVGHFAFLQPAAGGGLYTPGTTIHNDWGVVPYTVESDARGFRTTGAASTAAGGRTKIVAIGDSITDGFFVDDEQTFPHRLQRLLDRDYPGSYEVINAARGGASIGKELAILKQVAVPLDPRIVILTFVTNDPAEIIGKSKGALLEQRVELHARNVPLHRKVALWLITRTAVGEGALRLFLHVAGRGGRAAGADGEEEDPRYVIDGGTEFERNAAIFLQRNRPGDGLVLTEPLAPNVLRLMQRYLELLDEFVATCRANDIEPVLVYFPAYPQIYLRRAPRAIQDLLEQHCERLGIPFLDLTHAFRRAGRAEPLHLAPLDFHPNPRGNQVMAEAIHEFLVAHGRIGP